MSLNVSLKRLYSKLYTSAIGQRVRHIVTDNKLIELKPFARESAISDMFVWRISPDWSTTFHAFNISSFLYPDKMLKEQCELLVFDSRGNMIASQHYELQPLELKLIYFKELVGSHSQGTFAFFHYSQILKDVSKKGSHITERGYVSYARGESPTKSFCHGNLQALSKTQHGSIKTIVGTSTKTTFYHPQLPFFDFDHFELVYVNPTKATQHVTIHFYDRVNMLLNTVQHAIAPLGVAILPFDNTNKKIARVSNESRVIFWRPIVFKYLQNSFDVLHS